MVNRAVPAPGAWPRIPGPAPTVSLARFCRRCPIPPRHSGPCREHRAAAGSSNDPACRPGVGLASGVGDRHDRGRERGGQGAVSCERRTLERCRAPHPRFRDGQGGPLPRAPARARCAPPGLHGRTPSINGSGHREKFVALRTEATAERPHGLSRPLTRHAPDGTRLVGSDNAHAARERRGRGTRRRRESGRGQKMQAIRPHGCRDAAAPPGDFRKEAGAVPRERGAVPPRPCGPEAPAMTGCRSAPWRNPRGAQAGRGGAGGRARLRRLPAAAPVARLGGYRACKHDPAPGNPIMWEGYNGLTLAAMGCRLRGSRPLERERRAHRCSDAIHGLVGGARHVRLPDARPWQGT